MGGKTIGIRKEALIVCGVLMVGFLFRIFLISTFPQPMIFDQEEYEAYARRIYDAPLMLASHSYRPFPYPLMVATIYKVFGLGNHNAVFVVQAILDTSVGLFIYLLLRDSGKFGGARWLGLALYSLNPFTAAYTGVILSEILSTWLIAATLVVGVGFIKRPGLSRGVLLGLMVTLAAETRLAAFLWAIIPIALTLFWVWWKRHKVVYLGVLAGIALVVWYPLWVNARDFGQPSLTMVDNIFIKELFIGALTHRLKPFDGTYPPDVQYLYREYYTELHPGRTASDRQDMAQKYRDKLVARVAGDPIGYLVMRLQKIGYLWHTDVLFPYKETGWEWHRPFTFYGNLIVLIAAVIGLVAMRAVSVGWFRWLWATMVASLIYATASLSLTIAEHRLTIPFYPIILLSASIGFFDVWQRIVHRISSAR